MEVALVYFVVLAAAFFLLIVRPQRRRLAAHREFVQALEVGDEIVTSGGVFGTIRGLDDDAVDLEIAPGVVIRVARGAVQQRIPAEGLELGDGPVDIRPTTARRVPEPCAACGSCSSARS